MAETLFTSFLFSFCIPSYSSNPNIRQIAYHLRHRAKADSSTSDGHHNTTQRCVETRILSEVSTLSASNGPSLPAAGQLSWVLHHNRILVSSRNARRGGEVKFQIIDSLGSCRLPPRDSNIQVRFVQNGVEVRPILGIERMSPSGRNINVL